MLNKLFGMFSKSSGEKKAAAPLATQDRRKMFRKSMSIPKNVTNLLETDNNEKIDIKRTHTLKRRNESPTKLDDSN